MGLWEGQKGTKRHMESLQNGPSIPEEELKPPPPFEGHQCNALTPSLDTHHTLFLFFLHTIL